MAGERLTAIGDQTIQVLHRILRTIVSGARTIAAAWSRSGATAWLRWCIQPLVWLVVKFWLLLKSIFAHIISRLRWLLIPKGDTPFDALKHYVSVILAVIGLTAILWAGKQIAYPPIVITVSDLPESLKNENWINPELSRALADQIERMRTFVKDERNPTFEAVLNPPNIVVKSGEFSLNIQEQILSPLGSLLGRSHGEVHLTLNCLHPGCLRTEDPECQTTVPAQKDQPSQARNYLCLRLTADVQRGTTHRRITPRLALNGSTYDADMTKQMAKVAETVASVADPATAALYFYRRVKVESPASRSSTNDPLLISELRGEAFRAAEQAEAQDAASACWAHSVRAQLAIDRREFKIAETFINRAKDIPYWRHLLLLTNPVGCWRLIVGAEIAMTRELSRKSAVTVYPAYSFDVDRNRRTAADEAMRRIVRTVGGEEKQSSRERIARFLFGSDQAAVAELARAEVALTWFDDDEQCSLLAGGGPETIGSPHDLLASDFDAAENGEDSNEFDALVETAKHQRPPAWRAIRASINKMSADDRILSPPARSAALDFLERLSKNETCQNRVRDLVEKVYLRYPDNPRALRLLAGLLEASALAQPDDENSDADKNSEEEQERRKNELDYARKLYERMVDIGDDRVDIAALARLALIDTAFSTRFQAGRSQKDQTLNGPPAPVLQHLTRAWQRFQGQLYPTDVRHHAEIILSFWGSILLASYPQDVVQGALLADARDRKVRDATVKAKEFQAALQILFPGGKPATLAEFPQVEGIGTQIGCLCLLIRMSERSDKATSFFLTTIDKWQQSRLRLRATSRCIRDLTPSKPENALDNLKEDVEEKAQSLEELKASTAAGTLDAETKQRIETATAEMQRAKAALDKGQEELAEKKEAYEQQRADLDTALNFCHVDRPNIGSRTTSPKSTTPETNQSNSK
ncbi:MAG TPA: hypothetical protein VN838_03040 [Bradyrhizobium sp.]|nr:hypothetical protein [Bradyrhizobium sp.]